MKLVLTRRMFFAGSWREPGEYVIGKDVSHTDAKCAVADNFGQIVKDERFPDKRDGAPENKLLDGAPENKGPDAGGEPAADPAAVESGDSGGTGPVADAGSVGKNPLLAGAVSSGGGKQRASKGSRR